jgi:hypothetical protein
MQLVKESKLLENALDEIQIINFAFKIKKEKNG